MASGFAVAQQPAQQPTFRAGAVLVTVDAYPQQDGRIVEGLRPEDFEVLEDGKPQNVENFEFVRVQPALTEDARRDPNSSDEANTLAADPRSRVFVAFLDQYHVAFDGSHATRKPLVDTLRRVMSESDLFGVMTPKMRGQDLTLGRKLLTLEEELARYWPWGERGAMMHDPDEDFMTGCLREEGASQPGSMSSALAERRREDKTLTSLEGLIAHLGRIREARTVVLTFTNGWKLFEPNGELTESISRRLLNNGNGSPPMPGVYRGPGGTLALQPTLNNVGDGAACASEMMRLAQLQNGQRFRNLLMEANRRNVSFYPIDPRGIAAFDDARSVSRPVTKAEMDKIMSGQMDSPLVQDLNNLNKRIDTLKTLAENTDGLTVITNDLSAGLRRVVDDVSAYYLLGYYSSNTRLDGGYHRIQVRMKRPGLNVRARRGYFAPNAAEEAAKVAKAAASATAAPVADALALLSRLRPSADLHSYGVVRANELSLVVEIPSSRTEGGRFQQGADVEALIAGQAPVKGRIEPASRGVMLTLPLATGATGPWRVDLRVTSGPDRLEDRATVEAAPAGALLADPIAYRAAPGPRSPIRPVADFQFRRTERVHIEWPILKPLDQRQARLLGKNGLPLAVAVNVTEGGRARREDSESSSAGATASGGGAPLALNKDGQVVLSVDVILAPLSAGDYVIEITAGSGGVTEKKLLAIRVVQ